MSLVESGAPSYGLRFRTWYKQSERFTPTRDLCLQGFSVSDSESAWHLIESSPVSEISCFGSNPRSSRGPDFYAVVYFLLRLFIDYLWFLMSCHMAVLYWLRPTWIPRGNCSADETRRNLTGNLNFLLIFEFFEFQCLNPEEKKHSLAGIPGNCFYNKPCKFWEVLQERMVWSGWQLYRNFQIFEESILGKPPTETVRKQPDHQRSFAACIFGKALASVSHLTLKKLPKTRCTSIDMYCDLWRKKITRQLTH